MNKNEDKEKRGDACVEDCVLKRERELEIYVLVQRGGKTKTKLKIERSCDTCVEDCVLKMRLV